MSQVQYDKLKRKALLGGTVGSKDGSIPLGNQTLNVLDRQDDSARLKQGIAFNAGIGGVGGVGVDVGAVVGNMEAAGVSARSETLRRRRAVLSNRSCRSSAHPSSIARWPAVRWACRRVLPLHGDSRSPRMRTHIGADRWPNVSLSMQWTVRTGQV